MIRLLKYAVCASIALGASISALRAEPKFTLFQIAEADQIQPVKITNTGEVAGYYRDMYGNDHGFIRSPDGTLSTFDVPGSYTTTPTAENEDGTITGWYGSPGQRARGFARFKDGTISTFAVGKQGLGATEPTAINNAGWIAIDQPGRDLDGTGYLRDPSGQLDKLGSSRVPTGINSTNVIVGNQYNWFPDNNGWLRDPDGTFIALGFHAMAINDSNSVAGYAEVYPAIAIYRSADGRKVQFKGPSSTEDTVALAINNHDVVVGYYETHGFIWRPSFSIETTALQTVDVPGAGLTQITGINDSGVVAGFYEMPDQTIGAFIRSP